VKIKSLPILAIVLLLSGCGSNPLSTAPTVTESAPSTSGTQPTAAPEPQSTFGDVASTTGVVLDRLNSAGSLNWTEDPFSDTSGSGSLATFLEGTTDGCAVWVFPSASSAKSALDSNLLDFPGHQIYTGADPETGFGIILVSPYSGADCEYVVSKVFNWG